MDCVFCGSAGVVRNGTRKRKVAKKQSYWCTSCTRQFVEPNGFERMRHKPKVIVRAIHMHNDGMSLSTVQNHLWQHDNVKVTRRTISQWHKKYSDFLKSAARTGKAADKGKNTRR